MSEERSAWYHHFWPWFILGLLGVSVVASLATVAIAVLYADVEIPRTAIVRPDAADGPARRPADAAPEPPRVDAPRATR